MRSPLKIVIPGVSSSGGSEMIPTVTVVASGSRTISKLTVSISANVTADTSSFVKPWEQMRGDERARFCDRCNLHRDTSSQQGVKASPS